MGAVVAYFLMIKCTGLHILGLKSSISSKDPSHKMENFHPVPMVMSLCGFISFIITGRWCWFLCTWAVNVNILIIVYWGQTTYQWVWSLRQKIWMWLRPTWDNKRWKDRLLSNTKSHWRASSTVGSAACPKEPWHTVSFSCPLPRLPPTLTVMCTDVCSGLAHGGPLEPLAWSYPIPGCHAHRQLQQSILKAHDTGSPGPPAWPVPSSNPYIQQLVPGRPVVRETSNLKTRSPESSYPIIAFIIYNLEVEDNYSNARKGHESKDPFD